MKKIVHIVEGFLPPGDYSCPELINLIYSQYEKLSVLGTPTFVVRENSVDLYFSREETDAEYEGRVMIESLNSKTRQDRNKAHLEQILESCGKTQLKDHILRLVFPNDETDRT